MASSTPKSLSIILLYLNLILYGIVSIIAGWAINYGIEHSASGLSIPVRLFPMHFPIGNMATGFFIIFSLIAGVVGMATSITGINNMAQWDLPNLLSAATSSIATWSLTLLAMGLACKEINIGFFREKSLWVLEILMIILSGTQLFCMAAIHAAIPDVVAQQRSGRGRL